MSTRFRINYVACIDPFRWSGGGEAIARGLIEAGTRLGHQIRRTCVFPSAIDDRFEAPDFWLLADVHNRPGRGWRQLPRRLLDRIVAGERYVHLDNAYVDVCDLPYLPCDGRVEGEECPFKQRRWLRSRRCFRVATAAMYRHARLNLFLSPLHRRTVQALLGADTVGRVFEMRPLVDTGRFRNEHRDRDIDYLYLGYINEAKGGDNLARVFPDGNLTLAGHLADPRYATLGRLLGRVPYDQVPVLLNRARVFVHLPRWPEPQGRTVAEAALCGCRLMTNENVGATSFGLDLADPATYAGAAEEAWAAITEAIERPRGDGREPD
jgi:glycosyltransferase involved in cell wall biosynthesis